jgi:hypothetical protein
LSKKRKREDNEEEKVDIEGRKHAAPKQRAIHFADIEAEKVLSRIKCR